MYIFHSCTLNWAIKWSWYQILINFQNLCRMKAISYKKVIDPEKIYVLVLLSFISYLSDSLFLKILEAGYITINVTVEDETSSYAKNEWRWIWLANLNFLEFMKKNATMKMDILMIFSPLNLDIYISVEIGTVWY